MKTRNFRKLFFAVALVLVVGVAVSGCMNRNVNEAPNVVPSPSPNFMPQGSATNGATDNAAQSNAGSYDWTKNAAQIEARLSQISEISEARVVVTGSTALVGVKFSNAYQGEMTERIREMIAGVVKQADASIQTVAVTNETDDVTGIYDISDKVRGGQKFDEFKEDINSIVRNITTMR